MIKTKFWRILSIFSAFAAMTAVTSCYNDADLKQSIDDLDQRVAALEEFRDQVQSEIASLTDIVNKLQSSVTIDNVVEGADGGYTINFSDGTSVTIKDGEDGIDGLTPPSITIVQDDDGEYYWARENEDGSYEFILDNEGNKIPATGQAPMVRINDETGNWEISSDGGLTWEDTGMPSVGGSGDSLIIDITEDENNVYFHLRGGTVIAVPKTTELAFEFGTTEETLYFAAGESKTLNYTMSGASQVVITKPDGWKASIESEGFVIVAPVAENTYAETEGTVSVIVTAANGQSLIASIAVTIGTAPVQDDVFSIEVPEEEIGSTSARVISSCYQDITWSAQIMSQDEFDNYVVDKQYMEQYFMDLLESTASYYGYASIQEMLPDFLYTGEYVDDYVYSSLYAETKYLTYAVGMNYDAEYTTEFYWGPEFTTTEVQLTDMTFEIIPTPATTSVSLDIYPSDKEAYYFATVIDNSFYEAGYTDEDIMQEICNSYGWMLMFYALSGDIEDYSVSGMAPETDYFAVAFGVDVNAAVYTSAMTSVPFTTLASQPTDAYATASMNNYWSIDDLAAYNPTYGGLLSDPENPVLAAVDFEYNADAASCVYILWIGDVSGNGYDELYSATLSSGDIAYVGDPAPLFYVAFDSDPTTLCVIAMDANGNYGDMYYEVITFPESGKSTDYALFDEYYNAIMGGSYSASVPAIGKKANYVEREAIQQVITLSAKKHEAGKTKVTKVISK